MKDKIIVCDKCSGVGTIKELLNGYEVETIECDKCNGSGRLFEIIEHEPFI